jgi:hypothetical protein
MTATVLSAKKPKGISGERAHRLQRKFISRIDDIYHGSINCKLTYDEIREKIEKEVTGTSEWERVPEYVRAYINGYCEARLNELHQYHLVWVLSCDGLLMTSNEVNALTKSEEDIGINIVPNYSSPWNRIDSQKSRYIWKDANGLMLLEKPFSRRFLTKE